MSGRLTKKIRISNIIHDSSYPTKLPIKVDSLADQEAGQASKLKATLATAKRPTQLSQPITLSTKRKIVFPDSRQPEIQVDSLSKQLEAEAKVKNSNNEIKTIIDVSQSLNRNDIAGAEYLLNRQLSASERALSDANRNELIQTTLAQIAQRLNVNVPSGLESTVLNNLNIPKQIQSFDPQKQHHDIEKLINSISQLTTAMNNNYGPIPFTLPIPSPPSRSVSSSTVLAPTVVDLPLPTIPEAPMMTSTSHGTQPASPERGPAAQASSASSSSAPSPPFRTKYELEALSKRELVDEYNKHYGYFVSHNTNRTKSQLIHQIMHIQQQEQKQRRGKGINMAPRQRKARTIQKKTTTDPIDTDYAINRIKVLVGERKAGNNSKSLINEASSVLDYLLYHKIIPKQLAVKITHELTKA